MLLFVILLILLLLLSYLWFRLNRFYRRMSARYEQRMRPVFVPVATLVVAAAIILFVPFWTVQIQGGPVSENVASTKEPGYIVVAEGKEHGQSLWNVLTRLIRDEDREEALKTGSIAFELANLTRESTKDINVIVYEKTLWENRNRLPVLPPLTGQTGRPVVQEGGLPLLPPFVKGGEQWGARF